MFGFFTLLVLSQCLIVKRAARLNQIEDLVDDWRVQTAFEACGTYHSNDIESTFQPLYIHYIGAYHANIIRVLLIDKTLFKLLAGDWVDLNAGQAAFGEQV